MAIPPPRILRPTSTRLAEILALWIVLVLAGFSFGELGNEVDVLPYARQFFDSSWLPNDWYLSLQLGHRYAYSLIAGPLVTWVGFTAGSVVLRLGLYLLLAASFRLLFRTLHIWFPLGLLALFLFLDNQSLASGEWILGGGESKVVAYAMVLVSLSALLRQRYRWAWACAGLAVSFHILVGLYSLLCLLGVLLWTHRGRLSAWRETTRGSWLFLVTGAMGAWVAGGQLLQPRGGDPTQAWLIYVEFRNPHHLVPSAWGGHWVETLTLFSALFLVLLFLAREPRIRSVAVYGLGCVLLFLAGLCLPAVGAIPLLRFYPFRLPDVMLPLLGSLLLSWILGELVAGRIPWRIPGRDPGPGTFPLPRFLSWILRAGIVVLAAGQVVRAAGGLRSRYEAEEARVRAVEAWTAGMDPEPGPLLAWIEGNTPRDATFLVDPTLAGFHLQAERADFVSFKEVPTAPADILEWYRRITLANGGSSPVQSGFAAGPEIRRNFNRLTAADLRGISGKYDVGYYVSPLRPELDLPLVHESHGYALYRVTMP